MNKTSWSEPELGEFRQLDAEIADMVQKYLGGRGFEDSVFVPSKENLAALKEQAEAKLAEVKILKDAFWRSHFVSVLESFLFRVKCDGMLPSVFLSRNSNAMGSMVKQEAKPKEERLAVICTRFDKLPAMMEALLDLVPACPDVGKSQVATILKSFVGDIKDAAAFVAGSSASDGAKAAAEAGSRKTLELAVRLQSMVAEIPVTEIEPVHIPFDECVLKGMQAPLDYILEWVDQDVEKRRRIFFETAKKIDPARDAYDLLNHGSETYSDAESLLDGMRNLLSHMQKDAGNFVDLPEGEVCKTIATPDAYKMVCPTAMYMNSSMNEHEMIGYVCLNTDNLDAFSRATLEETAAHEVYPGHHTHFAISATRKLPRSFMLDLPSSRCIIEGLAHRSEYLMIPYYVDPVSELECARRGWYCSSRVRAEVSLYRDRRSVKEVWDNYVTNLNCTEYSANGQMQAHLSNPADAISYYTGMRILEDLCREMSLSMSQKQFTDQSFRFGNVAMQTLKDIFGLPQAKRDALGSFLTT